MLGAETDQVLGGDKGKVHAGLEEELLPLHELVAVVALGEAVEVRDRFCVLADQDECGMERDGAAQHRQAVTEPGAEEETGRVDDAAGTDHYHLGPDPVLTGLPFGWLAVPRIHDDRFANTITDLRNATVGNDLDPQRFGPWQLHPIGALLGLIGTAEVAKARTLAALDVDRELLDVKTEFPAALEEESIVVVDVLVRQRVDVVFFKILH